MLSTVLLATGAFAALYGTWRGYAAARAALLPLASDGEPTRLAVERTRHPLRRERVRLAVRSVALAIAWLVVAMYGLYLAAAGLESAP